MTLFQGKVEFYEPPPVHGSHSCYTSTPCNTHYGRKCGRYHLGLARDDVKIIWYLLFNSALAYFVNLTNFLVTKHTSALTLQVCLLSA